MADIAERFRVSIRVADQDVDLTVAAHLPLRDLLPAIADAVAAERGAVVSGRELRLSHPISGPLDATRSLAQSGVIDGELLVAADEPAPRPQPAFDTCAAIAKEVRSARDTWRPGSTLAAGAPGFAALAGWLAVPAGPAVAKAALAMSACAVGALAAARVCAAAAVALRSLCAVSASGATLSLAAAMHWCPTAATGPMLASGWLVVLSTAPRLVARRMRLSASDSVDDALTTRTLIAHGRVTATVTTSAFGAVLGSLMTALSTPRSPASMGLLAAVAAILLLRMRIHVEAHRCTALAVGGVLVSTLLLGTAASVAPTLVPWLFAALATGSVAAARLAGMTTWPPGAGLTRVASAAEFAAAAAVMPLTCWAIGLFAAARELSLS